MNTNLIFSWLVDASLGSAIIFGMTAGGVLLLRRSSAAVRHLAWSAAFLGGLIYSGALLLPKWRLPLLTPPISTQMPITAVKSKVHATQLPPVVSVVAHVAPGRAVDSRTRLENLVSLAWVIGLLIALVRLAAGLLALARIGRAKMGQSLRLTVPSRARARLCPGVRVPLTWGWLRPRILLPMEFSSWSEAEQRFALLHELAHVRRGDWAAQILAQLVRAVFWFNPLAWLALRQLSIEQEKAADDLVLADAAPGCYASALVELANRLRLRDQRLPALPIVRSGFLEERVRSLVCPTASRRRPGRVHLFAAAGLLSLAALLGIVQVTAQETVRSTTRALNEMERRFIGQWQGGGMFASEMEFRPDGTFTLKSPLATNLSQGTWGIESHLLSYSVESPIDERTRHRQILQVSSSFFQWQFVGEESKNVFGWHRLTNIQLGTIAGVVLRQGKPLASTAVLLEPLSEDSSPLPRTESQTDAAGRFAFHGLAPGSYQVSRAIEWASVTDQGSARTGSWTHGQLVEVAQDRTHRITLGQGRTLKGKIVPPRGVDESQIAFTSGDFRFLTSVLRPPKSPPPVYVLELEADGSFLIPDVPPGNYSLFVSVRRKDGALNSLEFASVQSSLVAVPDGSSELDLGRFELQLIER